jgi:ATP-dependent RNA helicase MRH4
MPRPRRARNAQLVTQEKPAVAINAASDNDEGVNTRERTRSTRSSARLSGMVTTQQVEGDNNTDHVNAVDSDNDDTGSSLEVGRRAMATPAQQRRDTSGLDLADDDVFGDIGDSFEDGAVPAAPRSAETTSFSLSGFKTRSRQSSIIGRNDPPIRPSSRAGSTPGVSSTFNIGAFKRRAREPSILATSRKTGHDNTTLTNTTAATTGAAAHNSDVESEEEDFAPEAESTPVNNRRSLRMSRETTGRRPVTRKRKSEESHENSDRPEKASRTEQEKEHAAAAAVDVSDNSDSELSSLPSPQHPSHAWLQRPVTPLNEDEIIAPPASSGSESEGEVWPDIHGLAKRRRRPSVTTPLRADNASDVSSPPSLTHSPNYAEIRGSKSSGRSKTRHHRSPRLTTADLANLLPKRRYKKNRDSFDLSNDDETDDEQSRPSAGASLRRNGTRSQTRGAGLEESNNALQPKQTPVRGRPGLRSRSHARRSSDKENESGSDDEEQEEPSRFIPMPDDTFEGTTGRSTEVFSTDELRRASKKFQEVDQWQLSFEEMAPTSSPKGAR